MPAYSQIPSRNPLDRDQPFPENVQQAAERRRSLPPRPPCAARSLQGLFGVARAGDIDYSQVVDLDLSSVKPGVAGPKRPQDRVDLDALTTKWNEVLTLPAPAQPPEGLDSSYRLYPDLARAVPTVSIDETVDRCVA